MTRAPVMVFAGEFWSGASGNGLSEGFRDLGWAVQELDFRYYAYKAGRSVADRAIARAIAPLGISRYQADVLKTCRTLKPDVFLTIKGTSITSEMLNKIRADGAKTIMYYPDLHFKHPNVSEESFELYDYFVTTKSFQIPYLESKLGKKRVAYIPHGYSSGIHRPLYTSVRESEYAYEALYAGNQSPYKQNWLEGLVQKMPELDLNIMGNNWSANIHSSPLMDKFILQASVNCEYAEAIQTARINIAVHYGPTNVGDWEDKVSTRTFEIPACKGFMLHIDNEEVREFFEPGKEIDVFSTPEELADKITFYLERPELRTDMIERAYKRCAPNYSYNQRAKDILSILR